MSTALAERISQEHAAVASALPTHVVTLERRRESLAQLASVGLPSVRDDNWKYANLRPLERVKFTPASEGIRSDVTASDLPAALEGYTRYVFLDGRLAPQLSRENGKPGVKMCTLRAVSRAAQAPSSSHPDARFAWLNEAFVLDGAWIRVAPNTECLACIEIVFAATEAAQAAASYPRLVLDVAPGAHVGIVERHVSVREEDNFVNGSVDVRIGRGATVEHHRLQQTGARTIWLDTLSAELAEQASYCLRTVSLGAASARSTMRVQLAGEGSEVQLHSVAVARQHQVLDSFAVVEHIGRNTRSDKVFRGIAHDRARAAFNSKVVVRESGRGTDSRQSLRGLLAGPEAEIDVRPQLEIYTDEVRSSHGATAGKLDDQMLFYLLSRGIERETAQRLLKWAFLEDVVSRIVVPELRRQIESSLAGQMKEADALKELL